MSHTPEKIPTLEEVNQFIDNVSSPNVLLSGNPSDDPKEDKELSDHKKKLKKHHRMLMDKAEKHLEKDEKELAQKCLRKACQLSDDMDDESKDVKKLSLESYDIDEASLGSEKINQLNASLTNLEAKFAEAQAEITALNAKLSNVNTPAPEQAIANLKAAIESAELALKGVK